MREAVSESARWRLRSEARHREGFPKRHHQKAQPAGRPKPSVVLVIYLIARGSDGSDKRNFKISETKATKRGVTLGQ